MYYIVLGEFAGLFYSPVNWESFNQGEFDDRIEWSNLNAEASGFKGIFNTEKFWEDLLVEENDIYMGELKEFFSTNKKCIHPKYYKMFTSYEKGAKKRIMDEWGEEWEDLYLPH